MRALLNVRGDPGTICCARNRTRPVSLFRDWTSVRYRKIAKQGGAHLMRKDAGRRADSAPIQVLYFMNRGNVSNELPGPNR